MKNEYELKNAQELTHGLSTQMNYKEHIIISIINAPSQLVRPVLPVFGGHLTQQEHHLFELVSHYFAGRIGLGRGEHTTVTSINSQATGALIQSLGIICCCCCATSVSYYSMLVGKPSFRYRGCPLRPL